MSKQNNSWSKSNGETVCGFWNESENYWSSKDCWLARENEEQIVCECNHLTNFAALFLSNN